MIAYSARWGEDEADAADEPKTAAEPADGPPAASADDDWPGRRSVTAGVSVSAEGGDTTPGQSGSAPPSGLGARATTESLGEAEADWPPECFRC